MTQDFFIDFIDFIDCNDCIDCIDFLIGGGDYYLIPFFFFLSFLNLQ